MKAKRSFLHKSNLKFLHIFLLLMFVGYPCMAEPPGTMAELLIVFLIIAVVCSFILGLIIKWILRAGAIQASNKIVFFISSVTCLLSLYLLFK